MHACDLCHQLVGEPSSVPPHENLAASGIAARSNRCKLSICGLTAGAHHSWVLLKVRPSASNINR